VTGDLNQGDFELFDLEADPRETRDLSGEQPERLTRMKRDLLAWNDSVESSVAGRDYPEGRVSPADPEPQNWYETPAYQPYLDQWKTRWEYRSSLDKQRKVKKAR